MEPSGAFKNEWVILIQEKGEYALMAEDEFGKTTDPLSVHSTCFYLVSQPEGAVVAVPQ